MAFLHLFLFCFLGSVSRMKTVFFAVDAVQHSACIKSKGGAGHSSLYQNHVSCSQLCLLCITTFTDTVFTTFFLFVNLADSFAKKHKIYKYDKSAAFRKAVLITCQSDTSSQSTSHLPRVPTSCSGGLLPVFP